MLGPVLHRGSNSRAVCAASGGFLVVISDNFQCVKSSYERSSVLVRLTSQMPLRTLGRVIACWV
jgi:hypothetical protein